MAGERASVVPRVDLVRPRGAVAVAVPLALAALELLHPTWPDDSPSQAVAAVGAAWIALHIALLVGYGAVVWILWPPSTRVARVLLALFALTNTAFLAVDGVGVGLLAPAQPQAADALWNGLLTGTLAALAGATWSAALLALAATRTPRPHRRAIPIGLAVIWFLFVMSSLLPVVGFASLLAATTLAAFQVYRRGAAALPFALLVVAAMLHQHVGPEAAGGMLCIAFSHARPACPQI